MFNMDISSPTRTYETSPSTASSPLHPASLVDPATHSPALLDLIDIKISRPVIDYIVDCVAETVDYAMGRPSSSQGRAPSRAAQYTKFTTFVTNVITRAEVSMATVLGTLVYIDRAKPHLHIALEEWAHERVFLGGLICASKYLNDSTLKNVHWALCTGVFGKRDVGRIEREFLDVLDFELGVAEHDFLGHHEGLMAVTRPRSHRPSRAFISKQSPSPCATAVQRIPLPELEPSSPESSSPASASPRTPTTLESSPDFRPPVPQKDLVHLHSQPQLMSVDTSYNATTLELLRSFPIPVPPPTHHGHQRIGTKFHTHSQIPIGVRS